MKTLKDKTAVITGAGSGIGHAIAIALAEFGVHIVAADIRLEAAQETVQQARALGVRAGAILCDVSKPDSVHALAEKAFADFGAVHILCNNAGISWRPFRNIFDATLEDYQRVFDINYWGVLHGLKAFLPRMRQQPGEKHIVNTASLASMVPVEGHAAYCSSKAAVASLSEAVSREIAPFDFGVTILCPGTVGTNLAENTKRLQAGGPATLERQFEPVATPTLERMNDFRLPAVGPVGVMVRNAILQNQLYLHTPGLPYDMVSARIDALFGPSTVARA